MDSIAAYTLSHNYRRSHDYHRFLNSELISMKFCKGHFLVLRTVVKIAKLSWIFQVKPLSYCRPKPRSIVVLIFQQTYDTPRCSPMFCWWFWVEPSSITHRERDVRPLPGEQTQLAVSYWLVQVFVNSITVFIIFQKRCASVNRRWQMFGLIYFEVFENVFSLGWLTYPYSSFDLTNINAEDIF